MCEIHFVMHIDRAIGVDDIAKLSSMLTHGAINNDDGFGCFSDKNIVKDRRAYKPTLSSRIIPFEGDRFVVAHNRASTSGKVKEANSHPFINERFIWVHNGVLDDWDELVKKYHLSGIRVDSQVIGEIALKKLKGQKVVKAIRKTLTECSGSFSVFIYDRVSGRLFYARHDANFTFATLDDKTLIGSTYVDRILQRLTKSDKRTLGLVPVQPITAMLVPAEDTLYEITNAGLLNISTFEVREDTSVITYGGGYGYNYWKDSYFNNTGGGSTYTDAQATLAEMELGLSESYSDPSLRIELLGGQNLGKCQLTGAMHALENIANDFPELGFGRSMICDFGELKDSYMAFINDGSLKGNMGNAEKWTAKDWLEDTYGYEEEDARCPIVETENRRRSK